MSEDPEPDGIRIETLVEDPAWRSALPLAEALAFGAARMGLARLPEARAVVGPAELAIVLTDDAQVRRLNRNYRGQDRPTNVLSFAQLEGTPGPSVPGLPQTLGDIVLARETIAEEAVRFGRSLDHHLQHLVVHGLLHLFGYDHQDAEAAAGMERLEREILGELGVPDPYHSDPGSAPRACGTDGSI